MSQRSLALAFAEQHGIFRAREAVAYGVDSSTLSTLVRQGLLERDARGLYRRPDAPFSAHHTLVEVAARVPGAVFCLLTALDVHALTTENPPDVYLALRRGAHRPLLHVKSTVVYVSEPAFSAQIESFPVEGRELRVTSAARTVADCFKFRSKIGKAVAIEALRDFLRTRRHELPALREAAATVRVTSVLTPYLEALL